MYFITHKNKTHFYSPETAFVKLNVLLSKIGPNVETHSISQMILWKSSDETILFGTNNNNNFKYDILNSIHLLLIPNYIIEDPKYLCFVNSVKNLQPNGLLNAILNHTLTNIFTLFDILQIKKTDLYQTYIYFLNTIIQPITEEIHPNLTDIRQLQGPFIGSEYDELLIYYLKSRNLYLSNIIVDVYKPDFSF